jgi:chromosome segregation ATPase
MQRSSTNGKVSYWNLGGFDYYVLVDTMILTLTVFLVIDQVAEHESTIQRLEGRLEEQSSEADNAISQWQESYTTLEVRSSELEAQLEKITKEKDELLNSELPSSTLVIEELRSEKDRLEQELKERDEALAAAKEDLNQDAEVVQEWEGKLLECCTLSHLTVCFCF